MYGAHSFKINKPAVRWKEDFKLFLGYFDNLLVKYISRIVGVKMDEVIIESVQTYLIWETASLPDLLYYSIIYTNIYV